MKFLMVYPNQQEVGCKPVSISMFSAIIKKAGHEFRLFDTTVWKIYSEGISKDIGEDRFEYKKVSNPERIPDRPMLTLLSVKTLLQKEVENYKPDFIGFMSLIHFFPLAKELGTFVKTFSSVPIIVGGIHATTCPDEVIKESFVDMVCIGEGEGALLDLLNGQDPISIQNLWVKRNGQIHKNALRPMIDDLDSLPFPDWDIYNEIQFYKPYMGKVYRYGDIERSRGCPFGCGYCVNPYIHSLYTEKSFRAKSTPRMIDELHYLTDRHKIEFIRFWDELFVFGKRFKEFSKAYSKEIALPFTIETTGESINDETARLLKDMNCQSVSIGFETGSEDLRKRILNKGAKNKVYMKAFKALKKAGIRSVAFIMLAIPEDNEKNYWDTIRFLKEAEVDTVCVSFFYPFRKTAIREKYAEEYERLYPHIDDVLNTKLDIHPILTDIPAERWAEFGNLMGLYKELPEWLWSSVPGNLNLMRWLVYHYKYGVL